MDGEGWRTFIHVSSPAMEDRRVGEYMYTCMYTLVAKRSVCRFDLSFRARVFDLKQGKKYNPDSHVAMQHVMTQASQVFPPPSSPVSPQILSIQLLW